MTREVTGLLLSGVLISLYCVIALHFLRFYRDTRDRLFVMFSVAFLLLAVQRIGLAYAAVNSTDATILYGLRVVAFGIIVFAILDKNRG